MLLTLAWTALAETGGPADSGDSGDTAPADTSVYVDTGATAERTFVDDVGCEKHAALLLPVGLLAWALRKR